MKKVFFVCFMIRVNISLFSHNVDVQTAKSLGTLFLEQNTNLKYIDLELSRTVSTQDGQPAFYVFTNKGKGFVIVSADDRMRPILGYSGDNIFNSKNINPNLNTFFYNYVSAYEYVVDNNLERSSHAKEDWDCLKSTGKLSYNRKGNTVKPLVTTTWNQSDIYNSMCPEDPAGFGGHAKYGCVANAMAQIMNYWEWPQKGQSYHSYQSDYGFLEANFGETVYQFELMPEFLDYTTSQAGIDAVALLLRNAEHLFTFDNPTIGENLSIEDQLDRNGVNYYYIYPMYNGLKGKAVLDTVMTGPVCELEFILYDSDDDGWLSPSISVLESRGIVVKRIGLENGSFDTITVSVPDNDTLTFFWNYVNAAYADEDEECSFEIYYSDSLIYQSDGKPQVGILTDFYVDCEHINVAENYHHDNEIAIYPNPVEDIIVFSGYEVENIVIYNALGQEICNEIIVDNKFNASFLKKRIVSCENTG